MVDTPQVTAYPLNGGVLVDWPDVTDATAYHWSTDDGSTWLTKTAEANVSNAVKKTGLTNGTEYIVRVRAVDAGSNTSPWSPAISITPSSSRYVMHWDDFNRASSAVVVGPPLVGNTYTSANSNWGISEDKYLNMSTNSDNGRVLFTAAADFDIEFKNVSRTNLGLIFRALNSTNFWALSDEGNVDGWQVWRVNGGFWSYQDMSFPRGPGPVDTIRVVARGEDIYFYLNGNRTASLTMRDVLHTTNPTLGFFADDHTSSKIDDVVVWSVDYDSFYGDLSGGKAHVYKGHDRHSEDTGDIP